jgi:DNA polymerase-3 subunit alpha
MKFVSLHHHSTFSYLDGFAMPEAHVRRASEIEMSAMALTEHGNISSHVKLEMAATAMGIKPIFGCELYCGDTDEENRTQRKNHLTVLAENAAGYKNLLRVVSQGWNDFYYEPTVSGQVLNEHRDGLVVLSGCTGSLLATSLVGGKNVPAAEASYDRGKQVAARFKAAFKDNYYLEVQAFPELEAVRQINTMIEQISKELKIPMVATGDFHYTQPSEGEMQQILHNLRPGKRQTLEEQARNWGYDVLLCPPATDRALYRKLRGTGLGHLSAVAAITTSSEIAERCTVTLPKLPTLRFPLPEGYLDAQAVWRDWIKEGWSYRECEKLSPKEREAYRKRLRYEMHIIESKDYIDYFLVVSDLVKFSKDTGIPVGPARGSAAASLVCFLLRITEVNPMLFPTLVFERFIDITRQDLPDIDLDFDSDRRYEIRDYLTKKYGQGRVGNIGTFNFYKSKNSLDDIARVYHIPQYEVDTVKELLIERSSGDLRASATIEDTVAQFDAAKAVFERFPELRKAMSLEGNVKGMGVHAAGLVISNGPITDVCAIYRREVAGRVADAISLDKYDAERQGLVKIDVLGLSTMSMIAQALRMLDMKLEDLYKIPLDDPKVIDGFKRNDVVGIFQFDGRAMRSVNSELSPDNFKEICDINALARPGPLHNGATAEYIDAKRGKDTSINVHPLLANITGETHYQIVYQEQILKICMEIGGFDWTHAAYIRKIISKKIGEQEFNRQYDRFRSGALERGLTEAEARDIWDRCITAGSYAFNNAHTVSYGMLAWWTMWLKVYHPQVFYVASLQSYEAKQLELLKDATRHGLKVTPPDPVKLAVTWAPFHAGIRAGLTQVPGFGEKMAVSMMEYNQENEVTCWADYANIRGIGPKKIEALELFERQDDPFGIYWLKRRLEDATKLVAEWGLPAPTHTSADVPYSRGQDEEVIWIGVLKHRNLRDLFELHYSRTGEELDPDGVRDARLREWVVAVGEDDEEMLTITWDRWKYTRFKNAIWSIKLNKDVVLIKGVKKGYQARKAIYVTEMYVIDMED